jgi:hypothetical protein
MPYVDVQLRLVARPGLRLRVGRWRLLLHVGPLLALARWGTLG